jgi:hypothetical protein
MAQAKYEGWGWVNAGECWDGNKEVGNKFVVEVPSEVLGVRVSLLNDSRTID